MSFQLAFSEAARQDSSRRHPHSNGSPGDPGVLPPSGGVRAGRSALHGLAYGLPISLALWALIALAVWAVWVR